MTEQDAKYFNKLNSLKSTVFNELVASYRFNNYEGDDDFFMDNLNRHFNEIVYPYTKSFVRDFAKRNPDLFGKFSRDWYDINALPEDEQQVQLLDFYLNGYAWSEFSEIVRVAKLG